MASFTLKLGSLDLSSYTRVHPQDGWDPYGGGDWANPQFSDAPFAEGRPLLNIDAGNREMVWPLFLRGTGGSHAWTPNDITGCELWLAADKITGLTDGTAVSSWTDSSGNSRHAVQATGGLQPVYKTAIVNGLPVVRFDAVDDLLNAPLTNSDATRTVFVVVKGQATNFLQAWALNPTGGAAASILSQAAGTWSYAHTQTGTIPAIAGSSVTSFSTITTRYNSTASCDLYVNGAAAQNIDPSDAYQDGTKANFQVGGGLGGDIAEIIVFNSALSGTDLDTVRNYLGAKYNLGYGSTPAAVTDSTSAKDNLHTLVQQINREIANPTSSPLRVEWKDQGASNSTFFDVTYARWDPHFNYRLGEKGYADGAVRVWCQPPYGHTATERVIATAAGTAPGLIASLIGVASPLLGDVGAMVKVKLTTSGEPVGPGGRLTAIAPLPVAGYLPFISAASFVGIHSTATVTGASGAPGSQAIMPATSALAYTSRIGRFALGASPYAGANRIFGAIRPGRANGVCAYATDDAGGLIGPTAVVAGLGGYQLIDLGVARVPTVTATSVYAVGMGQIGQYADDDSLQLLTGNDRRFGQLAGVYVLPEAAVQANRDRSAVRIGGGWFGASGSATAALTLDDYANTYENTFTAQPTVVVTATGLFNTGSQYINGALSLKTPPMTSMRARTIGRFPVSHADGNFPRMEIYRYAASQVSARAAFSGATGGGSGGLLSVGFLDAAANVLAGATLLIPSVAGQPLAGSPSYNFILDLVAQRDSAYANLRFTNANGVSINPGAGATTVPVACVGLAATGLGEGFGYPRMSMSASAGAILALGLWADKIAAPAGPSDAYTFDGVTGRGNRAPVNTGSQTVDLAGGIVGPAPRAVASTTGIAVIDAQIDGGPMNDPMGVEVRCRERFTYAR